LVSNKEYGDFDATFEFMMATHSNSGFYLQGRYELQLMDSWGVKNPNRLCLRWAMFLERMLKNSRLGLTHRN